ncbi:carboxymuconolactone decarboxylase family protein [Streptomyces sp. CAU 1734]|uniref:carboxymuconolactone decarboxylase family protein n=1 Tax=Streptomyces sp. CAU 1734 TaxID=3140360 RepID=UPI00325FE6AD
MRSLVRMVLRGSLRRIRYIRAVPPGSAEPAVARVYAQARSDFGVVAPPTALHSPAPRSLAASWLLLRETLLAEGAVSRAAKEAVATAVSRANTCPYCVEVHRAKLDTLPADPGAADPRLTAWASAAGRGEPAEPPFTPDLAPEICGVAVTFHYLNRMAAVFLDDSPVPAFAPDFLRGPLMRTVVRGMRADSPRRLAPGLSLDLLPAAPLPPGLSWALPAPHVAQALARAAAAVERGARSVPEDAKERLRTRLAEWDGTPPGVSRAWLGPAAGDLPAARLALLTALAPYQVTEDDIAAFRRDHPTDRELIELTSWAALTTALHIGSRLTPAPRP